MRQMDRHEIGLPHAKARRREVGETESVVPTGLGCILGLIPALKRWASFDRPDGTDWHSGDVRGWVGAMCDGVAVARENGVLGG